MRKSAALALIVLVVACRKHEATQAVKAIAKPEVKENGEVITFLDHHQTEIGRAHV